MSEIASTDSRPHEGQFCPDCGQNVSSSLGSHAAPPGYPADVLWGWKCENCDLLFPERAVAESAPTMVDGWVGIEIEERDGSKRLAPVPESALRGGA